MEDLDQALDTGSLCPKKDGIHCIFAFKVCIGFLCRQEMSNPIQFQWLENFATESMPFRLQRVFTSICFQTWLCTSKHVRNNMSVLQNNSKMVYNTIRTKFKSKLGQFLLFTDTPSTSENKNSDPSLLQDHFPKMC